MTPLRTILMTACLAVSTALAQPAPKEAEKGPAKDMSQLDITADSVEMDFANRKGTFVGNVKVADETMLLLADKMIVHLTEKNELRMIEAMGNVVISEVGTQKKATAGKAVFDVKQDLVVLSESPSIADMGQWTLTRAHLITYDRKKATFKADGSESEPIRISLLVPDDKGDQGKGLLPGMGKGTKEEKEQPK